MLLLVIPASIAAVLILMLCAGCMLRRRSRKGGLQVKVDEAPLEVTVITKDKDIDEATNSTATPTFIDHEVQTEISGDMSDVSSLAPSNPASIDTHEKEQISL